MTEFAQSAVRLAGLAGVLLGWRPDEFWAATPAELGAVTAAMMGDAAMLSGDDVASLRRMLEAPFARELEEISHG